MAVIDIDSFVAKFQGGGARSNLYLISIAFPALVPNPPDPEKTAFMCRAASLPESTLGVAIAPFMGRSIKFAGDRDEQEDWETTILNDTDFDIRRSLETWQSLIKGHESNIGLQEAAQYYGSIKVEQLNSSGNVIYTYNLNSVFPVSIGAVELAYDNNNTIQEFSTTFSLNYFTSDGAI